MWAPLRHHTGTWEKRGHICKVTCGFHSLSHQEMRGHNSVGPVLWALQQIKACHNASGCIPVQELGASIPSNT